MELAALTAEELNTLRIDLLNEQERRANLAAIPAQVAVLAAVYCAAGGAQEDLAAAIAPALE